MPTPVPSAVQVRPFRRTDREQLTTLANAHVQAVVPAGSLSVNAVLSQLEREPGEFIVDPWVVERATLVAEQRGRVSAAAHVLRYGSGEEVGSGYRGAGEIRWLLCWPDAPFWPDASAAGAAAVTAAVAVLRRWRVTRVLADGTLPAPGVYGLPEQWPHVRALLTGAGFAAGDRTELVLLADVDRLPGPVPRPDLEAVRTLGISGTRFTARRDGAAVGFVEVDTGIGGPGRIAGPEGWADIGNLHVVEEHRRRGVGSWLLGQVAEWLRWGRVPRLLAYADPDEAAAVAFLERSGFTLLTRTTRGWHLPT